MSISSSLDRSLRTRFVVGMATMLLPLVVLAVGAVWSLQSTIVALDDVVEEATDEIARVLRLRTLVQETATAFRDDLTGEHRRSRHERLLQVVESVRAAQRDAASGPFGRQEERALIESVLEEWTRQEEAVLTIPHPMSPERAQQAIRDLDGAVERVSRLLDRVDDVAREEMVDRARRAHDVRRRALAIVATVFVLGLGAAILVGTRLARSVLAPVRALDEGAARFSAGDLGHRVSLASHDELGHLGATLNAMAQTLAANRSALEDLSNHDALTGLHNYREFRRRLTEEMDRAWRYGRCLSLLALDIDDFKGINDTYGHLAGDEALRAVSGLISREVRPVDEVARYGGDEFTILLPETEASGAAAMAGRISFLVGSCSIAVSTGQQIAVTVSIGVATYPQDAEDAQGFIDAADRALYAAKNSRRTQGQQANDSK